MTKSIIYKFWLSITFTFVLLILSIIYLQFFKEESLVINNPNIKMEDYNYVEYLQGEHQFQLDYYQAIEIEGPTITSHDKLPTSNQDYLSISEIFKLENEKIEPDTTFFDSNIKFIASVNSRLRYLISISDYEGEITIGRITLIKKGNKIKNRVTFVALRTGSGWAREISTIAEIDKFKIRGSEYVDLEIRERIPPKPEILKTNDPNWKLLINNTYDYRFEYPSGWIPYLSNSSTNSIPYNEQRMNMFIPSIKEHQSMDLYVWKNEDNFTLFNWLKGKQNQFQFPTDKFEEERFNIKIAGQDGFYYTCKNCSNNGNPMIIYFFAKDDLIYRIRYDSWDYGFHFNEFKHILETFEFDNQISEDVIPDINFNDLKNSCNLPVNSPIHSIITGLVQNLNNDWVTYQHVNLGVSIEIPNNWVIEETDESFKVKSLPYIEYSYNCKEFMYPPEEYIVISLTKSNITNITNNDRYELNGFIVKKTPGISDDLENYGRVFEEYRLLVESDKKRSYLMYAKYSQAVKSSLELEKILNSITAR